MKTDQLRNRKIDIILQNDYVLYKAVCINEINNELPIVYDYYQELWFERKYNNDIIFQKKCHQQSVVSNGD